MDNTLGTNKIIAKTVAILKSRIKSTSPTLLDIGSGDGSFIKFASESIQGSYFACDYTDKLITNSAIKVDIVNLNNDSLPYPKNSFDAVSITEVIEHLENPRKIIREVFDVLRPGGVAVISTPNILNIKSRLRFLMYGFWNLFGPLKIGLHGIETTNGHISPISYFYIAHAMKESGFENITVIIDKVQKSSIPAFIFLYPFIKLNALRQNRIELKKFQTIDSSNEDFVQQINSVDLLLGRTIIVAGEKKH